MTHLLVTNDFPPKTGGIQNYLWELWRRLPAGSFTVVTCDHPGAAAFDAAQPFPVVRLPQKVLWPTPDLARRVGDLASDAGADFVVLDPALPLGALGAMLRLPFVVVAHGAEITVPGRLPASRRALASVLRRSAGVVAAGDYVAEEVRRAVRGRLPGSMWVVPPGVDPGRFRPLQDPTGRAATRSAFGLPADGPLVLNVGRLVPRKGADVLVAAAARLRRSFPDVTVAVVGGGRDSDKLAALARRRRAPVRFLGKVPDDRLAALYACADVFAAPTRTRWGGLEQEGFGIVFLEAAAAGIPQVAGASGGAPEAVIDGVTGLVVAHPEDPRAVEAAIARLLDDAPLRARMGTAARQRAEAEFSYDVLATRLATALGDVAADVVEAP